MSRTVWPPLPYDAWSDTYATLHRYAQIVGKVQLLLTPRVNHFWNVAFHLSARGLRTLPIPFHDRTFELEFDLLGHNLIFRTSEGQVRGLALTPRPVADFYREVMAILASLGIEVAIYDHPVEIPWEAIPFHLDRSHASYDPEAAERLFHALSASAVVLGEFRARFLGKCSPIHFFWGSFDLAVSRFSGRRAPARAVDPITRESYSHETISAGFWPGDPRLPEPAFYCYAAPMPEGLAEMRVAPPSAYWKPELGEFILPYDAVRRSGAPREILLEFLQSSYEAAAELMSWDREALERQPEPEPEKPAPEPTASA